MDIDGPWQKILKISFVDTQPLAQKRDFIRELPRIFRQNLPNQQNRILSIRSFCRKSVKVDLRPPTFASISAFPLSAFLPSPPQFLRSSPRSGRADRLTPAFHFSISDFF
jgi:hypothetical protein